MGKTYDQAPKEVHDRVAEMIRRFHPDLSDVAIRIDVLMASTDVEDGHAVTCGGYPASAVIKILGPKERAKGNGDAEIVIDRDAYEAMSGAERDALVDHELYHLEVRRDNDNQIKFDDHQRPLLRMRKHDFQVGWFHEVARRHQQASGEVRQATEFIREQGRQYFGDIGEELRDKIAATLPTEDSAMRASPTPIGIDRRDTGSARVKSPSPTPSKLHLEMATEIVTHKKVLTLSMLQRVLNVGERMARAIADNLVSAGVLSPESDVTPGRFSIAPPETAPPTSVFQAA